MLVKLVLMVASVGYGNYRRRHTSAGCTGVGHHHGGCGQAEGSGEDGAGDGVASPAGGDDERAHRWDPTELRSTAEACLKERVDNLTVPTAVVAAGLADTGAPAIYPREVPAIPDRCAESARPHAASAEPGPA